MDKKTSGQYCQISPARITEIIRNHTTQTMEERIAMIAEELRKGFTFLEGRKNCISFFGSARCGFGDHVYQDAKDLAGRLAKAGFGVITGGGPGIMEAANKGAAEAGGKSVGLNIELPKGQRVNPYVEDSISFHHFFVRKVMLAFSARAYVFFPGGFGTLDEFFELIMLIQTGKTKPVPVVLVERNYWDPLLSWIREVLYQKNHAINEEDMELYTLVDHANEAYEVLKEKLGF